MKEHFEELENSIEDSQASERAERRSKRESTRKNRNKKLKRERLFFVCTITLYLVLGVAACVFFLAGRQSPVPNVVMQSLDSVGNMALVGEVTEPEPEAEPEPEPEPEEDPYEGMKFYKYQTTTRQQYLNVRVAGGLDKQVLGHLRPGTTGYILDKGEEWSLHTTDDRKYKGYSFNQHMIITEIPIEEYPEDLLEEARSYFIQHRSEQ